MRKLLLLLFVASAFSFSSCKKCWKCGPVYVDGNETKQTVCDESTKNYYEQMGGRVSCKVHYESK